MRLTIPEPLCDYKDLSSGLKRRWQARLGDNFDYPKYVMNDIHEKIAGTNASFDEKLEGGDAIADYIETFSTVDVDSGLISELFHRCTAILKLVPMSKIHEGNPDGDIVSKAKMKRYAAMDIGDMPPIVIDDGVVRDGNHRFRIAKAAGCDYIWAYVVGCDPDEEELTEAPISDFSLMGDWDQRQSFHSAQDRKLLQNPKAVEKIKAMWNKTDYDFNLMFLNAKEAKDHQEIGFVDREWLEKNLSQYLEEIKVDPNAINVLHTNNATDARVPMTGWVIAHRLFHAASRDTVTGKKKDFHFNEVSTEFRRTIARILHDGYGLPEVGVNTYTESVRLSLFKSIGTMRSSRDGTLLRSSEFLLEVMAQYILTGRIKFNPLPAEIPYGKAVFGRRQKLILNKGVDGEIANNALEDLAEVMEHNVSNILGSMIGSLLVM